MQPQGADAEEGGAMKEMHKYLVSLRFKGKGLITDSVSSITFYITQKSSED